MRQTTLRRSRARVPLRAEPLMPSMASQGIEKTPLVGSSIGSISLSKGGEDIVVVVPTEEDGSDEEFSDSK